MRTLFLSAMTLNWTSETTENSYLWCSYGFDFPLKLKFPLFDREWLKIILADRGLLYLMWSCYWAESKGFIGSTIVITMLLVYVWSIGRVSISRDVCWNSSLIFHWHSVFEAQVYYEFLWTLRALSERFEKYLSGFYILSDLNSRRLSCPLWR